MYREITDGIQIDVEPAFLAEKSRPEEGYYFFAYWVRIKNTSEKPAQLVSRHWIITDGKGRVHEVRGAGVVGQQPMLSPGEEFEYTSFCPLETPTGNMRGTYQMVTDDGTKFEAKIPLFFLRKIENDTLH